MKGAVQHDPDIETIKLYVNGLEHEISCPPRTHLADALRQSCDLTGTHLGCEQGVCGACTVLIEGKPMRACLQSAHRFQMKDIQTIEGLIDDEITMALKTAFSKHHALQCGYCTPGMLITARDIVIRLPMANEHRVREELSGNLCRCTGYAGIVAAILDVLKTRTIRVSV
jgi:carbon-monoxide dehydrogenase small subunit